MINKSLGFDLQKAVDARAKQFAPPASVPQISVPQWKEGSPEWIQATLERAKSQQE